MSTATRTPRRHATTPLPEVVDLETWQRARDALLATEKAHTRAGDALAAERRRLPMVEITGDWELTAPGGEAVRLLDMFEGRRQLVLYHHMLKADDPAPCGGCSAFGDGIGHLAGINERDVTFAMVSVAPIDQVVAYRERMGWTWPFYSTHGTTFNDDLNPSPWGPGSFALSVFLRDGERVFRTWTTQGRGVEACIFGPGMLDTTPFGRQEAWEDSPSGWPQEPTYQRGTIHDELTTEQLSGATMPSSTGAPLEAAAGPAQ